MRLGVDPRFSSRPDPDGESLYAPDFFLEREKPWVTFARTLTVRREGLGDRMRRVDRAGWNVTAETPPREDLFREAFARIRAGFREDRWTKVVPYAVARLRAETGPPQIARALERLLALPATFMPYGLWTATEGMIGATPELLLRREGRRVTSVAMAGTRVKDSGQLALHDDAKQITEHRTVLEGITSQLATVGRVESGAVTTADLRDLQHLSARITAVLPERVGFEDLVKLLHPTPALGASPRGAADDLLRDLEERIPRGRFGAPFGWRAIDDDGHCVVAIRNVQWQGDRLALATGCGVVAASRLEDEWAEILAKQTAVRNLIGLEG